MTLSNTMNASTRGLRQDEQKTLWAQGPARKYHWIVIDYEEVTTSIPVRTGAARPVACRAAHYPCPVMRMSQEGQAA